MTSENKHKSSNLVERRLLSAVRSRHYFKMKTLAFLISYSGMCFADPGFNPLLLENLGPGETSDLEVFTKGGNQAPGKYTVDIFVNNSPVDHKEISFYKDKDNINPEGSGLIPCLTLEQLKQYGVKIEAVPELAALYKKASEQKEASNAATPDKDVSTDTDECINFIQIIPSSSAAFEFDKQALNLSFPQAVIEQSARGYVDPALWDEGINALLMDYNFTGSNNTSKYDGSDKTHDDSYYLSLRNGANFGPWRLRNYSTLNDTNGTREWQNINTYIQRSIIPLKSQLTLGDGNSGSDVFDSSQYRGMQLASDDQMLPDSQQGFAPVVRGIAKTNAQVTIKQNGYTIYQGYVSPGAFEINDLYASGDSGDLDITIKEEDGSSQHFIQPYSAVPILQREGHLKYSLTAGQYRGGYGGGDKPNFGQLTLIRGFSHGLTLYGGAQGSKDYMSAALGVGKNIGDLGAVSIDVTQAKADLPAGDTSKGQSYRFLYAKSFVDTGTDFRLLGYRYSTSGFYTMQEAVDMNNQDTDDTDYNRTHHKRSQVQGSITQTLPKNWGSLYFSASQQDYWGVSGKEKTLQGGYNNSFNGISYSIAVSKTSNPDEPTDTLVSLNISVPLDRFLKGAYATYGINHDSNGHATQQAGLSGQAMDERLDYSVNGNTGNQGDSTGGSASLNYRGNHGNSNVGYSYTQDSQRLNYGLSGGVIAHAHGVTLSQPLGETMVLVEAPGASDVNTTNDNTVGTDFRGYALLPYVTPYRRTSVGLDTTTMGNTVDISDNIKDVIPTRGAVVRAKFNTHVGYRVLMTLLRADGKPVPFGASVSQLASDQEDENTAIVGDSGETYLSGLPEEGKLIASWGKQGSQSCVVTYKLNITKEDNSLMTLQAKCLPETGVN
ncbi:fimbrial biogenesis outer membrane usher protein [Lelliottia aquatilis]|nr:fimbria/pilus outer membrane usher protein [Lelliottia aquatilis]NTZ46215.1 fimbrial biogenesis outer membrane usher protein [Lelliottia aquatilis]